MSSLRNSKSAHVLRTKRRFSLSLLFLLAVVAPLVFVSGYGDNRVGAASAQSTPPMSFFVSSAKSKTVTWAACKAQIAHTDRERRGSG